MKNLRLCFLFISPLLITACASSSAGTSPSPQANQSQLGANSFQPPAGMAGLYIYEEGSLIRADNSHRIAIDGKDFGLLSSGSYVYTPLPVGQHTVTCETSKLVINAQAGQNYFVKEKTNLDAGGQILNITLSIVTSDVATPKIKDMQIME